MTRILMIVQIILAIILMLAILLQHRGTSLGGAFGGESTVYRSRRGAEKFLYWFTIVIALVFALLVIVNLLI
ncbi:MAG: preprotein translocase subunit SecG [Patescibacteria group bacterium]